MSENIFHKIITNTASKKEREAFFRSLEGDDKKREEFIYLKNLFILSNYNLRVYDGLKKESFIKFWNKVNPNNTRKMLMSFFRYAAVFLIAVFIGFMVRYLIYSPEKIPLNTERIEYSSEKGSVSTIYLEDGSKIWLSSDSQITIDKNSEGEMSAKLNGEAYFDLIPNPERKFIVDLGYFKVKDIGTKFNIRAYTEEDEVFSTLVNGKIDIFNNADRLLLSLKPGEYMQFDKQSKSISVSEKDTEVVTAWKDGKFVFIDKTLSEICMELENWYNIRIIIEDKKLANTHYTSVVKRTTTVELVLEMLSLTDNIQYKIINKKDERDLIYVY